jgi:hypothetical protein
VETVRIGDRLTFRIEIPEKTPYGIFARYMQERLLTNGIRTRTVNLS